MIAIFPETLTLAEKGQVEHLAVSTRRYFEPQLSPRLDMDLLLSSMGIQVEKTPLESLGALVARDRGGRFSIVIILRRDLSDAHSQKFMKAHLLGHYLLHLQPIIARGDLQSAAGYQELACPLKRYGGGGKDFDGMDEALVASREEQCDRFAASLLLPKGMVIKAWKRLEDFDKIAKFFDVNKLCLRRRLQEIGLIETAPQSFLEAEKTLQAEATVSASRLEPLSKLRSDYGPAAQLNGGARTKAPETHKPKYGSSQTSEQLVEAAASHGAPGMARIREIAKMLDKSRS